MQSFALIAQAGMPKRCCEAQMNPCQLLAMKNSHFKYKLMDFSEGLL